MKYQPTIGLEVHAELKTQTKMFCDSLNDPNEKHPNTNVCPICVGHPGTLPTINKTAVESVLKVGMALSGDIPQFSKFDRKNYFYPDLPKGYQISQYDLPLVFGGVLNGVRLRRVHLEEDTGRLMHTEDSPSISGSQASLVDFNRAGVPLMELVTEPDIKNAEQAVEFARELQLVLRYLGVSDADMEKGQMRIEANVSLAADGGMGTKVEVKNINSFKAVHDAIEYEIKRQTEHLEKGEKIIQETRGWDANKGKTVSQRKKEEAHDYRYFPEPDLPPLDVSKFDLSRLKEEVPELPKEKRIRFAKEYGLTPEQADILTRNRWQAEYFEESASELLSETEKPDYNSLFNYLTSDLFGLMAEADLSIKEIKIDAENFADLVKLVSQGKISSRVAKDVLKKMFETGLDPTQIVEGEGLSQISDGGELESTAKKILEANPSAVADYKKGKGNALQFLIGKAMAELKGRGNPGMLQEIFKKLIG
ncbi:MAG: Asp-tRNA(Asn)/Glu-tRNA(Gln) amidotransferase subunit GatB [Candidatus Harrisonbacteria bacterium]|nr:Asp-tRNA(Asn)/Glu-tRNA(Gln) amidotransferase subunit GatB [Candidatus Harrisonbacteria bacterium]